MKDISPRGFVIVAWIVVMTIIGGFYIGTKMGAHIENRKQEKKIYLWLSYSKDRVHLQRLLKSGHPITIYKHEIKPYTSAGVNVTIDIKEPGDALQNEN